MSDTHAAGQPDPGDRAAFDQLVNADPELSELAVSGYDAEPASPLPQRKPAPTPAPTPTLEAPEEPPLPTKPDRPEFPLRRLQSVGLAMTVAMAAVGQVMFWREFFGGGVAALLGAVAIAAAFEVLMIGATDTALDHKASGSRWWRVLFPVGALAATVAATVQLLHWNVTMGVPFAAAALIGWGAHAISGWIAAQHYRQERDEYDSEVERRRRKAESRADAAYERQLADWETQRQATRRAVAQVEPEQPKKPKASKPKKTPAAPNPTDTQIADCWRSNGHPGAGTLRSLLIGQGFAAVGESTLRKKLATWKETTAE